MLNIRCLCVILILQIFLGSNSLADTIQSTSNFKQITSFADIVEPLVPAVVNIYTIQYNNIQNSYAEFLPEFLPLNKIDDFLKKYNFSFSIKELNFNSEYMSLGSGFIIDENGFIVTNNHVVDGSDEIHIKLHDNTDIPARIIGKDSKTDLTLLKIDYDKKLPFVKFADSNLTRLGDIVIAIGNPFGFGGTVTTGIISSKSRDLGFDQDELVDDFIQIDAAINIGNSGGPLFNIDGQVIGINTSVPAVGDGTNVGIGFAIPSNTVQSIVEQLQKTGKVSRGKLDISIQEVSKDLADAFELDSIYGVLVVDVVNGGVGQKSGLKRGDLIVNFNDEKVLNLRKLQLFVADTQIGDKIKLGVIRNAKNLTLEAEIFDINNKATTNPLTTVSEESTLELNAVTFGNISTYLISKFNLSPRMKGITVIKAPQEKINFDLKSGDVIMSVDQQEVKDIKQFELLYEKGKNLNKKNLVLLVHRKDINMFVALPILK